MTLIVWGEAAPSVELPQIEQPTDYSWMDSPVPTGSTALQLAFAGLALVLVLIAWRAVVSGFEATGTPPADAAGRGRTFLILMACWVLAVTADAASGHLAQWSRRPPPFAILLAFVVVLGVLISRSEFGDRLARGIPLAYLVGLHVFRLPLELIMHRAYSEGVMPVQMSYSGRNFDIVTGITALVLAVMMTRRRVPRAIVWAWNWLGLALLVNIVAVAVMSTPLVHYFGADRLNTFVARPPYVLLPAVMVLVAWTGHLVIFRALRAGK
ncbi:MAG: hypothetical protein ABI665_24400 [Vicinamibacterales bacterium]